MAGIRRWSHPALVGTEHTKEEIMDIAVNGIGAMPADQFQGTDEELEQLADFIIETSEAAGE